MTTADAVLQLLAVRGSTRDEHIRNKKATIAFLNKFTYEQQFDILYQLAVTDNREFGQSLVDGLREQHQELLRAEQKNPLADSGR